MKNSEERGGDPYKGEEEVNYDYDELIELYDVSQKIERDIKELWKNTIKRYMKYCEEKQILIQSPDYSKFYDYMVKNNKMYRHVLDRICELENR
ncbi:MAG: hypothetical protein MUO21_09325 [Nitrososphaeraceae archaeon]|nr:hypothetical protein [Nitrososphaeraceae archaeon]